MALGGKTSLKPGPEQIVTGHDMMTGAPVFLTPEGGWSSDPAAAAISASAEEAEALLAQGQAANARAEVELVELIAAGRDVDGRIYPLRLREAIRALGPTVRPDLGHQAADRQIA